jgi:hypothetical protein
VSNALFKYLFLLGLIVEEVIRLPHRRRNRRERLQKQMAQVRTRAIDIALDLLAFTGMEIIPIVYVFTPWLRFADYALPAWAGPLGAVALAFGVWLLWRAHADLGPGLSGAVPSRLPGTDSARRTHDARLLWRRVPGLHGSHGRPPAALLEIGLLNLNEEFEVSRLRARFASGDCALRA